MATTQFTNNPNTTRIITGILGIVALVVILNYGYWVQQAKYLLGFTEESASLSSVRMEANMLVIPRFNITAPIQFAETTTEKEFQEKLKGGVVHYPDTANIGEKGNPYIFGHSSNYFWVKSDYNNIFALLPKIQAGDIILASDPSGKTFEYIVQETKVVGPKDTQYLDQYDRKEKLLTVQTSYPVGTALKRFIVIAKIN